MWDAAATRRILRRRHGVGLGWWGRRTGREGAHRRTAYTVSRCLLLLVLVVLVLLLWVSVRASWRGAVGQGRAVAWIVRCWVILLVVIGHLVVKHTLPAHGLLELVLHELLLLHQLVLVLERHGVLVVTCTRW